MRGVPSRVIAGCLALAAFAVAIIVGLASANPTGSVLKRALLAMIVCYPVGLIAGLLCQRVIDDHVAAHRAANRVPDEPDKEIETAEMVDEEEEILTV